MDTVCRAPSARSGPPPEVAFLDGASLGHEHDLVPRFRLTLGEGGYRSHECNHHRLLLAGDLDISGDAEDGELGSGTMEYALMYPSPDVDSRIDAVIPWDPSPETLVRLEHEARQHAPSRAAALEAVDLYVRFLELPILDGPEREICVGVRFALLGPRDEHETVIEPSSMCTGFDVDPPS